MPVVRIIDARTREIRWNLRSLPLAHLTYLCNAESEDLIKYLEAVDAKRGAEIVKGAQNEHAARVLCRIDVKRGVEIFRYLPATKRGVIHPLLDVYHRRCIPLNFISVTHTEFRLL